MSLIEGININLTYVGTSHASLNNVNFTIEQGRSTLFLGRSGSGKTSLLKCIAKLTTSYSGEIRGTGGAHAIGFVAQQLNLFPHFTVLENCVHPQRHVLGLSKDDAAAKAEHLLADLGIAHLVTRKPKELSGGQAQRVAIARALCMSPKLLLLDEPTSALDPQSSAQLADLLKKLQNDGVTIAVSTHDMAFAKLMLDRAYFMESGEIVEFFDADALDASTSGRIAGFLA